MRKLIFCMFAMLLILLGCGDTTHEVDTAAPSTSAPTGAVHGFVRDYKTNAAIEDVTVKLYAAGTRTITTDENGYWYFDNVRADDGAASPSLVYTLTAPDADLDGSADYLPMMGLAALDETVGANTDEYGQTNSLTLVFDWMVTTATVSGFVTDAVTGRGINAATVVILDFIAAAAWGPGLSNAAVDSATLTTTTAARTEGGDGYYSFTTVPALTIAAGNLGAYATGYEYATPAIDGSALNLQFGSSAIVDFQLDPLDNAMGLVVASVTTATGTTTNMLIMVDATGTPATGAVPKVDMNGATQLVFTLIFDQAVDTSQFYGDTIQLSDQNGVVAPSLTALWSTGNYAVKLTGAIDIFDDTLANPYTLTTSRIIYAAGAGQAVGSGQIAVGNLAQFIAYNSTLVATPTPALYLDLEDTSIVGNVNVNSYDASAVVNPTTAQNYTGIYEENVLTSYAFTTNALANGIDIYWTDAEPWYDVSDISYYARERDTVSGEVLNNWAEVTAGATFQADDRFIAMNLNVTTATAGGPFEFYGGVQDNLRYGDALDIAVVLDDTLGVENAIDTAKILTLTDAQAPEITGFGGAANYHNRLITLSEVMSGTGMSISASNSALFTMSPEWDQDVMNQLRINAVGNATASVSTTAADAIVAGTGVITFDTAGEADLFFVGQKLNIAYTNETDDVNVNVTAINTAGTTPTITIAGHTDDMTQTATISVDEANTTLRSGNWGVGTLTASASATDTDITCPATNIAVGDTLILRDTGNLGTDISVTVVDFNSATAVATIASTVTTGYDDVIFPGDILTVTATDEAGNAMHANANEITPDTNGKWQANPAIR